MITYIVTRHGSNAANQHMCQSLDIGWVEASNRKVAEKRAREKYGDACYNNQHLTVTAASRVSAARWNAYAEDAVDGPDHIDELVAAHR